MWFPLATPLNARGFGTRCHVATSALLRSSSAGEISQQRQGSCPQFPSNFITLTCEGSGVRMNASKSPGLGPQPMIGRSPIARERTVRNLRSFLNPMGLRPQHTNEHEHTERQCGEWNDFASPGVE